VLVNEPTYEDAEAFYIFSAEAGTTYGRIVENGAAANFEARRPRSV
jgi:hypothetical protein